MTSFNVPNDKLDADSVAVAPSALSGQVDPLRGVRYHLTFLVMVNIDCLEEVPGIRYGSTHVEPCTLILDEYTVAALPVALCTATFDVLGFLGCFDFFR